MANVTTVTIYKINQREPLSASGKSFAFPSTACLLSAVTASVLSNGVTVNSSITTPNGDIYYANQTLAALATLFNT
jgi:hypothetical protein